jgi:hypothetical protein
LTSSVSSHFFAASETIPISVHPSFRYALFWHSVRMCSFVWLFASHSHSAESRYPYFSSILPFHPWPVLMRFRRTQDFQVFPTLTLFLKVSDEKTVHMFWFKSWAIKHGPRLVRMLISLLTRNFIQPLGEKGWTNKWSDVSSTLKMNNIYLKKRK